ncbi:farnesyl-diphosphate farnesyltransferase [Antricoccus suffuscus]|uniref:Farnesyl-diphosphate farnesyltransferase n=2 Tax=Antricoccus suffuscus TaxID=1629062 RepID=A0A2T0ZXS3_9ACTN|nr:farnesyl-diphosphate farnesyltransferase [Antricoccus suffuscus]
MNLDAAYAECIRITRTEARNFAYGIRLLPPDKRRAMSAVYAMARRIDDIGDGTLPALQKSRELAQIGADLHDLHSTADDPVLVALADSADRLPLPLEAFDDLIAGCQMDVVGREYGNFDDLVEYCRCVAGSVGRMSLGIYNAPDMDKARPLADALGVALQLTNILRDLREDRLIGRVYLPKEDLDAFDCTLDLDDDDVLSDPPDRFAALVRFEAERAERWYTEGLALLPMLDRRSAACTAAMAGIYHRLLNRIAAAPEKVRGARLSLPAGEKLAVAARALVKGAA